MCIQLNTNTNMLRILSCSRIFYISDTFGICIYIYAGFTYTIFLVFILLFNNHIKLLYILSFA